MLDCSAGAVLAALAAALLALLLYVKLVPLRYWERRGVPHPTPVPLLGNFASLRLLRGKITFAEFFEALLEPFRAHGYCGLYMFHKPTLAVWDPELAKQILTKEFSSFHDRGHPLDEEGDPLSVNLFHLEGARWRNLRSKLTPTFTSGRLRLMLPLMLDVSAELTTAIDTEADLHGGEVELKDLLTRFTTDVIGTCAFGIQCNSLRNKNTEFLVMSQEIFRSSVYIAVRHALAAIHPKLVRFMPFQSIFNRTHKFFLSLMAETVEHRKKNKVVRNDFVDLMMELQESDRCQEGREGHLELTSSVMAAQAFFFFLAGLDNVANPLGFCLNQLAQDADLQTRAAEEIQCVITEHGGELTYEALRKMDLVNRIVKEGLRLWSPAGTVVRKCNAKTSIGDLVVEKGDMVMVVTYMMHISPELFPDPLRFDPDRFTGEVAETRHAYAFLPFGEGPRVCIAQRFVMLQMTLALTTLLNQFHFKPCSRTECRPELDPKTVLPQPKNGFWVAVERRGGVSVMEASALP